MKDDNIILIALLLFALLFLLTKYKENVTSSISYNMPRYDPMFGDVNAGLAETLDYYRGLYQ